MYVFVIFRPRRFRFGRSGKFLYFFIAVLEKFLGCAKNNVESIFYYGWVDLWSDTFVFIGGVSAPSPPRTFPLPGFLFRQSLARFNVWFSLCLASINICTALEFNNLAKSSRRGGYRKMFNKGTCSRSLYSSFHKIPKSALYNMILYNYVTDSIRCLDVEFSFVNKENHRDSIGFDAWLRCSTWKIETRVLGISHYNII